MKTLKTITITAAFLMGALTVVWIVRGNAGDENKSFDQKDKVNFSKPFEEWPEAAAPPRALQEYTLIK